MKGLILAAGRGQRLGGLAAEHGKALVLCANLPLVHHSVEKLLATKISEIGIVVAPEAAQLRNYVSSALAERARIVFIPQPEPRGLAQAVGCARDFTGGDDFLLLLSDNIFEASLSGVMADWELRRAEGARALISVVAHPDPRACGVAVLDERGYVAELEEKPAKPRSGLALAGIYVLTPDIYATLPGLHPSKRGELEITDALAALITAGKPVAARSLRGFWHDSGTIGDLLAAQASLLASAEYASQLRLSAPGCELTAPVLIAPGSRVTDCRLGPNVAVAPGATLTGCTLSHCQVGPGSWTGISASRCILADGQVFSAQ